MITHRSPARRVVATLAAATALVLALPLTAGAQVASDGPAAPQILVHQEPTVQTIRAGGSPTFVISVSNAGNVPLRDVVVTSAATPACNRDASTLPALARINNGARVTYECTDVARFADYTSRAVATATSPNGGSAEDWADAAVEVVHPSVSLRKDTRGGILTAGDTATFHLSVRNDGEMELMNVVIIDPLVPACDRTFAFLAVDAVREWSCDLENVTTGLTNVAEVSAQPILRKEPVGDRIGDRDTADLRVPGISIDKTTLTPIVRTGTAATFEITVRNTGTIALVGTTVADPAVPTCDRTLGTLAVGAVVTYPCTLDATTASFTNVATVTATGDEGGPPVADSDSSDVEVIAPSIHLVKTASTTLVRDVGPVTFRLTVTNNGDTALTSVGVADAATPACDRTIGDLAPTDSVSYSCTVEALSASLLNEAVAIGRPPVGEPVTASGAAAVEVIHPAVTIDKTVSDPTVEPGDAARFTIVVTNSGDTPLSGVAVTDPATPSCDRVVGNLAAGVSTSYSCSSGAVTADFTNVAEVTGTPRLGPDVTDSDSVDVDAVTPAVALTKVAGATAIGRGADATFRLTVTNTGDTALSNVRIVDSATPDCDRTFAALAVGASETWSCVAEKVVADLLNIADVTATTPDGHTVTASARDNVRVPEVLSSSTASTTARAASLAVTGNDPGLVLWTSGALLGVGGLLCRRSRRSQSAGA